LDYKDVARMVSISAVMGLIFNLVWGIISDNTRGRHGRRRPYILIGGVISGLLMIYFAFSLRMGRGDVWTAYIICVVIDGILIGISSNAYYSAERALLPDIVEQELRGRANGIVEIIGYIGMILVIAVSILAEMLFGELNESAHILMLSFAGGTIIIIAYISFFAIKEPDFDRNTPRKNFFKELIYIFNFKELFKHKDFLKLILAMIVFRTGMNAAMPYIMIFITSDEDGLGLGTMDMITTVLIAFAGTFILIAVIGRLTDRYGRKKYLPISIVITSIAFAFVPFIQGGWNITPGGSGSVNKVLMFIIFPFVVNGLLGLITPMNAWSQDLLPEDSRGKFFGILNLVFTIPQIAGSNIGALIADNPNLGVEYVFWVAIGFFLLSIPCFLWVKETMSQKETLKQKL
jgi:Na+/melibiose symporter-like transporter